MNISKTTTQRETIPHKQRSYQEIVEFLDTHTKKDYSSQSLERMKRIDTLFGNPSQKLTTVIISGTNGKSLTTHYTAKLLTKENISVGVFSNPHILTYNERFAINGEIITNKIFTDIANEVIQAIEAAHIPATTREIITQIAFNYFYNEKVNLVILETVFGGTFDTTCISTPIVAAVTRLNGIYADQNGNVEPALIKDFLGMVKKNTHVICADQNKNNLKHMETFTKEKQGQWAMPIRKVSPLPYPFEQLHGRCAALAERIAFIFINNYAKKEEITAHESLLAKQKGQRGRPTLEQKKLLELNPKQTVTHFWKETTNDLIAHFQLLEKEKPTVLLDNASDSDALENTLLGLRLLHYQRPIKSLVIIMAAQKDTFEPLTLAKQIRYFFKKMSGHLIICSPEKTAQTQEPWNPELYNEAFKDIKVKIKVTDTFKSAFEAAKKVATDRNSLIAITGSNGIITEYFNNKGIKKF